MSSEKKKLLIDALSDMPKLSKRSLCGVAAVMNALDVEEQNVFNMRLNDIREFRNKYPSKLNPAGSSWLAKVLRDNSYPITDKVINLHIRGICSCR